MLWHLQRRGVITLDSARCLLAAGAPAWITSEGAVPALGGRVDTSLGFGDDRAPLHESGHLIVSETSPIQIEVLVDFDNVTHQIVRTEVDADGALAELSAELGPRLASLFPGLVDATVRLYGAWRWADGATMRARGFVASACGTAATSVHGYSLVFELGDAWSAPRPSVTSYFQEAECRCRYHVLVREQKLVDTMLVCDLIYFASFPSLGVVVVTDDHDVIPGFGQAAHLRRTGAREHHRDDLVWLRPSVLAGRADKMINTVARVTDYAHTLGGGKSGG